VLRSAVKNKTALFILEPKFGCDSDSVADRRERLSDKLFVCVGAKLLGLPWGSLFDCRKQALRRAIELRSEFFHCCIFAGNFTGLSTVQSYLCGD
jgi:hypothetical protein